ncbi:protein SRC1-like [Hibiscus syriacus]|uniref:protein SRC1-like n=1 Tax=Hibiscus syriacus TaxID=106335 RepID=UPI001921CB94|nr:protein SRC1-like [Hibiscus syriacus]
MSGIMHKMGETLHKGGAKKEEEKHQGEGDYDGDGHGYGTGMTGDTYMGEAGQGHAYGEQHKEGLMDKIKGKIHGDGTTEHGQEGEMKKMEKKKHEGGHDSYSDSY